MAAITSGSSTRLGCFAVVVGVLLIGLCAPDDGAVATLDPKLEADLRAAVQLTVGPNVSANAVPRASVAASPPARTADPSPRAYVIDSNTGEVFVSSSRDWWDDQHTIARLPTGTAVVLLHREFIQDIPAMPGYGRCKIRTAGRRRVTGWIMCGDIRPD
jgi:hypothetical protein